MAKLGFFHPYEKRKEIARSTYNNDGDFGPLLGSRNLINWINAKDPKPIKHTAAAGHNSTVDEFVATKVGWAPSRSLQVVGLWSP